MDKLYIENREKRYTNRYKLLRRQTKILSIIQSLKTQAEPEVLEIGAADGILLDFLNKNLKLRRAVGIEPSLECIHLGKDRNVELIQAVGEHLPFIEDSFNIIVAASVIDHLTDVNLFLKEAHRVLKPKGILIATAIVPFYDRLAQISKFDPGLHPHLHTFNIGQIKELLRKSKFNILTAEKFALPSFGILPFENIIEPILNKLHLGFLMFYSLVAAEKVS
jgi:ubiquinone/menaquinone biosynthesis C-methylase UbiE